tara:strand:+ start:1786 stop:2502 length:717 start_codon:yes stop_codon:yes gene_type:complete
MKVNFTKNDDGLYSCECGDFTGSRSGFYKHKAVKHSPLKEDIQNEPSNVEESTIPLEEDSQEDGDSTSWMDWGDTQDSSSTTDHLPTPLKALQQKATASKRSKKTKEEIKSARSTSKSIVTLSLTMVDSLLSIWGRGVLLDPDFEVKHGDKDKEITSDAVVGAMEEKGLFLSDSLSRTAVATVLVGWYIGAPAYKITKKAERGLFKGGRGSGLLSRIPLIGRLFKKKVKPVKVVIDNE